jgi:hypothetical protein
MHASHNPQPAHKARKENDVKNCSAPEHQSTRRILRSACATALAVAFTVSLSQPAHADPVTPPSVPPDIQVPAGNKAFLEGHGIGTQNYVCLPAGPGFAWTLLTPQATLFRDNDKQVTTHFFSPNPSENGAIRATWQHSQDTSTVWGQVIQPSSDPHFVAPGAIPWLLLQVVGAEDGSTGDNTLAATTYIQRLNTLGGSAPSSGCSMSTDVGRKAFVPYTADYFFYEQAPQGTRTPAARK